MNKDLSHDLALSTSTQVGDLSARPRADLEREDRPARSTPWRKRVTTIVC